MERLQELVGTHLARFSRRDPLRVGWFRGDSLHASDTP
ncbi:hypothetical protein ACFWOB_23325 [Streptomyces sp. NPDC058420]